jgi:Nucleotidyl transferase AbiEii toxin, Type IV TA system
MLRVTCYTGATPFERFTIDLSTQTHVVAKLDRVRPQPVIELAGAEPLPEFVLYPLPDQIADKVCAMYGRYGATNMPSTRYRDLVDLVLIATTNELDAMLTIRALRGERARRGCTLPTRSKIRALSGSQLRPHRSREQLADWSASARRSPRGSRGLPRPDPGRHRHRNLEPGYRTLE